MGARPGVERGDPDRGLVFNIQKFSLHDGSGIRTLVFLKGCPLACRWCSNPESQSFAPELAYNAEKCIGTDECGECRPVCASGAIGERGDGKVEIDRGLCDDCGECVDRCPSRALELFGKSMSVDEVIGVVEEDGGFYARSGGGLTVSGGEPLSQAAFVSRLLQRARGRGIDTALETSGLCGWTDLREACAHLDQLFFDVKCLDPARHERGAGVANAVILANLRRVCEEFPELAITVRTPVVPGFNDSAEEIGAIARFLEALRGDLCYELLPYHRFGEVKYRQLGRAYPLPDLAPPSPQHMKRLREEMGPSAARSCEFVHGD
jgi:pyruvate formate lyase activating enzyme